MQGQSDGRKGAPAIGSDPPAVVAWNTLRLDDLVASGVESGYTWVSREKALLACGVCKENGACYVA